ncbi:hypothetical protein JXA48_01670 [Candidatus Woesearchaeota archaeon]|nr:hypothetical protein [Candidatus Woesearchaeota archaeon]
MKVKTRSQIIIEILKDACNRPSNQLKTVEEYITHKEIDSEYYGFGFEEFKQLINQGYLAYWEPNEEEKSLPEHKKSVIATPKATELMESRQNRLIAEKAITVTMYIGLTSIFVAAVGNMGGGSAAAFGAGLFTFIGGLGLIKTINNEKEK